MLVTVAEARTYYSKIWLQDRKILLGFLKIILYFCSQRVGHRGNGS